MLLFYDINIFT